MKIYITADTTLEKVGVDYLEFSTPLGDILVDADEISSSVEDGVMYSKMKGVYFNELHGEIEVFDSRGRHLMVLDPLGEKIIKDAVRGRRIDV